MKSPKILILDYSIDQFETPLVQNCISEGMETHSYHIETEDSFPDNWEAMNFTHIVHTGSSLSINDVSPFTERAIAIVQKASELKIWQMGICYGHQLLALALVGQHAIRPASKGFEVGWEKVYFLDSAIYLFDVKGEGDVWQHHFDEVVELPIWSELLATNGHSHIQAYINYESCVLGTQFHPEFDLDKGNAFFRKDRKNLVNLGVDVDEILRGEPSFDTQSIFFNGFLKLGL